MYYSAESTINSPTRPSTQGAVTRVQKKREAEDEKLMALSWMERSGEILNRPMTHKNTMESKWSDRLERVGTASLKVSMRHHKESLRVEPKKLMDDTDKLKYSGNTAYIVHSQSTDDLKFNQMMEKIKQTSNYPAKWRQISIQIQYLKRRMKREETLGDAILSIGIFLRREATRNGNATQMERLDFIKSLMKTTHFEQVTENQVSLLFSTFDSLKKNRIRFADILVGMTILDRPNDSCVDKLVNIWGIYDSFGADMPNLDMLETILLSCAGSDADVAQVKNEFKEHFRPFLYKEALQNSINPKVGLQEEMSSIDKSLKTNKSKPSYYSVIDTLLDKSSGFRRMLEKSTNMVNIVDRQLSERLVGFYGKDPRYSSSSNPGTPEVSANFLHMLDK